MTALQRYLVSFSENFGIDAEILKAIVSSILVLIVIVLLRRLTMRLVNRHYPEDVRARYHWRKTTAYIAFFFGVVIIGRIWFVGLQPLSTYLGLLSAGLAIALHQPIMNLAGWLFIVWRRPFDVGDRIEIMGHQGDVIDQRPFAFILLEIGNWVGADQSTGRIINIPNGKVFSEPLANYNRGFHYLWDELSVRITFESNWRKAKEILTEIVNRHDAELTEPAMQDVRQAARKYMIFYTKITPIVYTEIVENGVELTLRYVCEPRQRRIARHAIWEDILEHFSAAEEIQFAYPTTRFFANPQEGKSSAREWD